MSKKTPFSELRLNNITQKDWRTTLKDRRDDAGQLIERFGRPVGRYPLWHPIGQLDWALCGDNMNLAGHQLYQLAHSTFDHLRQLLWAYVAFPYGLGTDDLRRLTEYVAIVENNGLEALVEQSNLYGPGTVMIALAVKESKIKEIEGRTDDQLCDLISASYKAAMKRYARTTTFERTESFEDMAPDIVGKDGDGKLGISDRVKKLIPRLQAWYEREGKFVGLREAKG